MKALQLVLVLALTTITSGEEIDPLSCRAKERDPAAIEVHHRGATYHVSNTACRDAFSAEPERFSQLFDAVAELEQQGGVAPSTDLPASLVPS